MISKEWNLENQSLKFALEQSIDGSFTGILKWVVVWQIDVKGFPFAVENSTETKSSAILTYYLVKTKYFKRLKKRGSYLNDRNKNLNWLNVVKLLYRWEQKPFIIL